MKKIILLLMMCHTITGYAMSAWEAFKIGYDTHRENQELGFWEANQIAQQKVQRENARRAAQTQLDYQDSDEIRQSYDNRVTIVGIEEVDDSDEESKTITDPNSNTIYRENHNRRVKNSRTNHNTNYQHIRTSTNGALLMSGVMIVCISSYIFYQWWSKRHNDHHAYHRA